ncbi:MAG: hypothetical protein K6C36_04405 [Clostridia bacterium]|nr:hypothetical protein [Clostridia bacterium]
MKSAKKLTALLLAGLMVFAFGFSAFADDASGVGEDSNPVHLMSYPEKHEGYRIVPCDAAGNTDDSMGFYVEDGGTFYFKITLNNANKYAPQYDWEKTSNMMDENRAVRYYQTGAVVFTGAEDLFSSDGSSELLSVDVYHDIEPDSNGVYAIENINCDITIDAIHVQKVQYTKITGLLRFIFNILFGLFGAIAGAFKS